MKRGVIKTFDVSLVRKKNTELRGELDASQDKQKEKGKALSNHFEVVRAEDNGSNRRFVVVEADRRRSPSRKNEKWLKSRVYANGYFL